MGEVVVSSVEMEDRRQSDTKMEEQEEKRKKDGSSAGVAVKWERFLQRMNLRVLVVESDDSTRQIIVALLRKCSYKVAAVPDGLKAWELLKKSPHNVDLILTEVDLPSISGFALLTLMMEHEICKNIPVIMMSSKDSIHTVYKCMARGAADYLVKPIRRNELRNLWQHVWRRQSSTAHRKRPRDEIVALEKIEVTSEDQSASNHSSGNIADMQRNNKYVEKGSDVQSSCTKPDFEAENIRKSSEPNPRQLSLNHLKLQQTEAETELCQKLPTLESEAGGSAAGAYEDTDAAITLSIGIEPSSLRIDTYTAHEECNNNIAPACTSRDASNLIQAFTNYPSFTLRTTPTSCTSNFGCNPQLDLPFRACHLNGFQDSRSEERHTLRQSSVSAFTRYSNKSLQHLQQKHDLTCAQQKEYESNAEKHSVATTSTTTDYASDFPDPTLNMQSSTRSLATGQSNQSTITTIPVPILVKGVRLNNNQSSGCGSVFSPMLYTQPASSPSPNQSVHPVSSAFQMNTFYHSNLENHNSDHPSEQNANRVINRRSVQEQGNINLDCFEDQGHISPSTDHSSSSSFCNGAVTHLNSMGYGRACGSDNNNMSRSAIVGPAPENKNEESFFPHMGNSNQSTQREAALTKFRLKRKDRCYAKKVRYESRKKLAEQRPRVKGQFIRQVQMDPSSSENNGNSLNGFIQLKASE